MWEVPVVFEREARVRSSKISMCYCTYDKIPEDLVRYICVISITLITTACTQHDKKISNLTKQILSRDLSVLLLRKHELKHFDNHSD